MAGLVQLNSTCPTLPLKSHEVTLKVPWVASPLAKDTLDEDALTKSSQNWVLDVGMATFGITEEYL